MVIELDPKGDERGSFARAFEKDAFAEAGVPFEVVHVNLSRNPHRHTLRGMHFQDEPHHDPKIVRCTAGAIHDVIVDLRPGSPTFRQWLARELTAENGTALHIPGGCAHGFLSLTPGADVLYLMGEDYHPELARGVRYDDPAFGIDWPAAPAMISDRDAGYPDFAW